MTLEFKQINDHGYYFEGAVNIGYVHHGDEGLLIDAGIDKSSIRKVLRTLEERGLPITHLFITHAHSDHYGGAHVVQKEKKVHVIAPKFEKAILENPMLEPLYLFGGNDPLPELRNKFLEGKPIVVQETIDEGKYCFNSFEMECYILPGHSYYQAGLVIDNILYAGDAYFSVEQLQKHKIPFITDAHATIKSLKRLTQIDALGGVPGHGIFEIDFQETVQKNMEYHVMLLEEMHRYIASKKTVTHEELVHYFCSHFQVNTTQLSQFLLFRTAVTAYAIGLIKEKKITQKIENYRWTFYSN